MTEAPESGGSVGSAPPFPHGGVQDPVSPFDRWPEGVPTRAALLSWLDSTVGDRLRSRRWKGGRRDRRVDRAVSQLEVESAWSRVLEFFWLRVDPASLRGPDHAEAVAVRGFWWCLAVERRRRGMLADGRTRWVPLREGRVMCGGSGAVDVTGAEGVARVAHPELGSCRVDLAAAFDLLTQRRREAVHLRIIRGLSMIEASEAMRVPVATVGHEQSRGLEQLRKMLAGEYVARGGRRRFVPDPSVAAGYRWEPVVRTLGTALDVVA